MSGVTSPRSGLLVSVRSVAEARAALAGGADLIDVKEPTRGSLGAADPDVVEGIVAEVAGRVPVSAAMGEWVENSDSRPLPGVRFLKWGTRGMRRLGGDVTPPERLGRGVLVAYADHDRADTREPEFWAAHACRSRAVAFLIDTAVKDGSTLLDWTSLDQLRLIRSQLAAVGIPVALAGSLTEDSIRRLAELTPDWFAVRGAVCVGGRQGTVCPDRVRHLKNLLAGPPPAAAG